MIKRYNNITNIKLGNGLVSVRVLPKAIMFRPLLSKKKVGNNSVEISDIDFDGEAVELKITSLESLKVLQAALKKLETQLK